MRPEGPCYLQMTIDTPQITHYGSPSGRIVDGVYTQAFDLG